MKKTEKENYAYGVYCHGKCVSDEYKIGCFESYEEAEDWIKNIDVGEDHPGYERDYTIEECELPEGAWEDCYEWPYEAVKRGYDVFFDTSIGRDTIKKIDCVGRFSDDISALKQAIKDGFLVPEEDLIAVSPNNNQK